MTTTTPASHPTPAAGWRGRLQLIEHAAATIATGVTAAAAAGWAPAEDTQIGLSVLGAGATWWVREAPKGWRRTAKTTATLLTAAATTVPPLVASHGDLSSLVGIGGVSPLAHVLATLAGLVAPNRTASPAGYTTPPPLASTAAKEAPTLPQGGTSTVAAVAPPTSALLALSAEQVAADAARKAGQA